MFVAEAPGADEAIDGLPLVGASGKLFNQLLRFAKIEREECAIGNVFSVRPPQNDVSWFFTKSKFATPEQKRTCPYHPNHGYLKPEWLPELQRLRDDIAKAAPKVLVPMGGIALWALFGESRITDYRGTVLVCDGEGQHNCKILPTFHPAAALRDYGLRPIIAQDLLKARGELSTEAVVRPERTVYIIETLGDVEIAKAAIKASGFCAFDVETHAKQITCISLAPSPTETYVIPFWDMRKKDYCAFPLEVEVALWLALWEIMSDPTIRKLAHNAEYDLVYLDEAAIKVRGRVDDTMLMSHSYQIEWPKSLGFLGSIFTKERAWKTMRVGAKKDRNKAFE